MSRLQNCFDALKQAQKKALIPYLTAGDPNIDASLSFVHALVDAGADIIELGVPFSDPMADGPTIQLACERALAENTSLKDVLNLVAEFRQTNQETPVVLMGYLNPVEAMGYECFAKNAEQAGVDAVLLVDLPPEEALEVEPLFRKHNLDMIYLIAPTTTDERIEKMAKVGSGYVYYVSIKGVTGSAQIDFAEVEQNIKRIRNKIDLPVGVGFGIHNGETAAAVGQFADGVIVGSALIKCIEQNLDELPKAKANMQALITEMRQSLDAL